MGGSRAPILIANQLEVQLAPKAWLGLKWEPLNGECHSELNLSTPVSELCFCLFCSKLGTVKLLVKAVFFIL